MYFFFLLGSSLAGDDTGGAEFPIRVPDHDEIKGMVMLDQDFPCSVEYMMRENSAPTTLELIIRFAMLLVGSCHASWLLCQGPLTNCLETCGN